MITFTLTTNLIAATSAIKKKYPMNCVEFMPRELGKAWASATDSLIVAVCPVKTDDTLLEEFAICPSEIITEGPWGRKVSYNGDEFSVKHDKLTTHTNKVKDASFPPVDEVLPDIDKDGFVYKTITINSGLLKRLADAISEQSFNDGKNITIGVRVDDGATDMSPIIAVGDTGIGAIMPAGRDPDNAIEMYRRLRADFVADREIAKPRR